MKTKSKKIFIIIFFIIYLMSSHLTKYIFAEDYSSGLTVKDFTLTNIEKNEEKSPTVEIERDEHMQLKIWLNYEGEPLKVGDTLSFNITQPYDKENGYLFFFDEITTPTPLYDSNGNELGTYVLKKINGTAGQITSGKFTITMTKAATKLENVTITTSDEFIYRHTTKVAIIPDVLASLQVGDITKQFLLKQEELIAGNGNKVGMYNYAITNNTIRWGFSTHLYEKAYNAKPINTEKLTFEDSLTECTLENLTQPITSQDLTISVLMGIPATACDGIWSSGTWSDLKVNSFFNTIEPNDNETYDDFKTRVKSMGAWSFGVYPHSESKYTIVFYQGNLTDAPKTYTDVYIDEDTPDFADVLKESGRIIGGISEEQKAYYNSIYSNDNGTNGKVMAFLITFISEYTPVKIPTDITQTVTLTDSSGTYTASRTATMTPNYGTGDTSTFTTVSKIWNDNNDSAGLRPESCTFNIYQNEDLYQTITLTQDNASESNPNLWQVNLINLPEYDTSGNQYFYSIEEEPIIFADGSKYIPSIEGATVTNTLIKNIPLTITKIWDDENNKYETRPETLNITLLQNETVYKTYTLNSTNALETDENKWQIINIKVPKYDSNGNEYIYTIQEDENNSNLLYYYQNPIYNQDTLTVTNTAVWLEVKDNSIPEYRIAIVKEIINDSGSIANSDDFAKIKLDSTATYNFPIVLKQLNTVLSKGETSMLEDYEGYSGNIYNGIVTNKGNLVFNNIPAGKYEISEESVQYFDFVNFTKISSTNGVTFSQENGKYYITISSFTNSNESIEIKVTNKIDSERVYNDAPTKNNVFKINNDLETPNIITFTIAGTEYQAVEDMTWEEWCASDYNTINFIANENGVGQSDGNHYRIVDSNLSSVPTKSDTVLPHAYVFTSA